MRTGSKVDKSSLSFDFEEVINNAQVLTREEVAHAFAPPQSEIYSPVDHTAEYMQRAVKFEEAWETTIQKAREMLLLEDARQLYLDFICDLAQKIESGSPRTDRYAGLLEEVAVRGLGMPSGAGRTLHIERPGLGAAKWRVHLDRDRLCKHLDAHIVGPHFLNELSADQDPFWRSGHPLIAASDVSQHRSAVPIPARYFKRSVPFVLNNAAGTLFRLDKEVPRYDNLFNPKPDEALLRWMLIDPSYQDELEPEDYQRCIASAMDVGQYKFDLEYLLKADKRPPDIVFRDGSLFPQDAYLDNYAINSKRGNFTREAIRELLACLTYAREVGVTYCGVTKGVQLKVYSAAVDWYIARKVDSNWEIGNYTLNDGQAMSMLLASPGFVGDNLTQLVSTCLIRRSFTTRANLNTRADLSNLDAHFSYFQSHHPYIDIRPFKRLCDIAHVYMFFMGHSKTPQQQLPRYEFFVTQEVGDPQSVARRLLSAIRACGLATDSDHSFMSDAPITYVLPNVTQQAHNLSKQVGKFIDRATGQWIMARYQSLLAH